MFNLSPVKTDSCSEKKALSLLKCQYVCGKYSEASIFTADWQFENVDGLFWINIEHFFFFSALFHDLKH
jgi:hypothetical protein